MKKRYRNFDTGEEFTLSEIRKLWEMLYYEIEDAPETFEDYLEDLLRKGRSGEGGIIEV